MARDGTGTRRPRSGQERPARALTSTRNHLQNTPNGACPTLFRFPAPERCRFLCWFLETHFGAKFAVARGMEMTVNTNRRETVAETVRGTVAGTAEKAKHGPTATQARRRPAVPRQRPALATGLTLGATPAGLLGLGAWAKPANAQPQAPQAVTYAIPQANPTGQVQVLMSGVVTLPEPSSFGQNQYVLMRVAANNQVDADPWILDSREQFLVTAAGTRIPPTFAEAGNGVAVPSLQIAQGQNGYLDLYFPLSTVRPNQVTVSWTVRRPYNQVVSETTFLVQRPVAGVSTTPYYAPSVFIGANLSPIAPWCMPYRGWWRTGYWVDYGRPFPRGRFRARPFNRYRPVPRRSARHYTAPPRAGRVWRGRGARAAAPVFRRLPPAAPALGARRADVMRASVPRPVLSTPVVSAPAPRRRAARRSRSTSSGSRRSMSIGSSFRSRRR